jgi:two-component system heavy metal sensor histidine kinase CusS
LLALNRVSLTQRLTLMFVMAATSVLLGLGFVVARAVEQHFEELDMEVLSGKMALIRQGLQTVNTADALAAFTHQLARSLVGHHGLEVMLLDADRAVIFATARAGFEPAQVAQQVARANETPILWTQDGSTYRVLAAQMPTAMPDPAGAAQRVLVVAATDIGHHQSFMQSFQHTLWLFVTVAAALTGALGWLVVRHGLAPLQSMRRQAQVVTAQQLSHRLPVHTVPPELAELAQSLNDMLARLEVAFARLSDFSSDIAHELRTPVSNLMTQTQVALSRARSASDYRSVLESNAEEFERLARMIADMLLLAKADNGLVVPNRESVDLSAEVTALFDYYEALAAEKKPGAAPDRGGAGGSRPADVAPGHQQPAVPTPCATPARAPAWTSHWGKRRIGSRWTWRTGAIRLRPSFWRVCLTAFFRVDPSRQRNQEGTGLGLAITRSIVAAHGGMISVTSSGGVTRFSIGLPIAVKPV